MEALMAEHNEPERNTRSCPVVKSVAQQQKGIFVSSMRMSPNNRFKSCITFLPPTTWSNPKDKSINPSTRMRFIERASRFSSSSLPAANAPPTIAPMEVPATEVIS